MKKYIIIVLVLIAVGYGLIRVTVIENKASLIENQANSQVSDSTNSQRPGVSPSQSDESGTNDNSSLDDSRQQARNEFLTGIGIDPDSIDKETEDTENGSTLVGNVAKSVKQYKTLAEAEEDMGFYLGLHNTLECNKNIQLCGLYAVGENDWYQAIFEDSTAENATITLKVSMTSSIEKFITPYYENKYTEIYNVDINGVQVTCESSSKDKINLVYFMLKNGRVYSLHTSNGNSKELMISIASELINNNMIMDDWK